MATAIGEDLIVHSGEVRTYSLNTDNFLMAALLIGDFDGIDGQVYYEPNVINYGEMLLDPAGYATGSLLYFTTSLTWDTGVTQNFGLMSAVAPSLDSVRTLFAPGPSPDVFNYGEILAEATNRAIGFESWDGGNAFINGSDAIVSAKAAAQALALYFPNGAMVTNDSQLLAHITGGTPFPEGEAATTILFGFGNISAFSLVNTGLIQATGTETAQIVEAIAIRSLGPFSIVNSGTISGVNAIIQYGNGNSHPFGEGSIENSGLIDGNVVLADGSDTFTNSGHVIGNINLGAGHDIYDGTAGTTTGFVYGGDGNDFLTGGIESDTLFGDGDDDKLNGLAGDDVLDGGSGIDTAIISGMSSESTVQQGSDGSFIVSGPDGTDTLIDMEYLQFDDQTISLESYVGGNNSAPVIIPSLISLQTIAGETNAFTVSATDADGDDLTYAVGPAGKGIVTVSGADVTYTAAPFASGSDSFTVTVSDENGGSAVQSVAVSIAAAPLPPEGFRLVLTEGWTGSVGGNGRVSGSNGFEDLTLLYGAITLDGSFNRGGDVVRFDGEASGYSVSRAGSSAAMITNNTDLGVIIPIGTAGLFTDFDDGARKLVFSGGYKLGAQVFTADSTPITAPDDGSILPTLADPAAKATLVLFGAALQPGQDVNVTIGGNVQIRGTNGSDIIRLDENGGDFIFDGSFNRGGDIIVLDQEAAAYTAVQQGASKVLIVSFDETLEIPIGTVGLTLRFADGDQTLIFSGGQRLIGEQEITTTPMQIMSPAPVAIASLSSITADADGAQSDSLLPELIVLTQADISNFIA